MSLSSCRSLCRKLVAARRPAVAGVTAVFLGGVLGALADPPRQTKQVQPPLDSAGPQQPLDYLSRVPEVSLEDQGASRAYRAVMVEERVRLIDKRNKNNPDGFVQSLVRKRTDLAGLPFLMGKACNLGGKQAKSLGSMAHRIRSALSESNPSPPPELEGKASKAESGQEPGRIGTAFDPDRFWCLMSDQETDTLPGEEAIRALQQLLTIEGKDVRQSLVWYLKQSEGKEATVALVQRVLFDLDADVRAQALAALKGRPAEDYSPVLLEGLRYPWAAVADRAARAVATLKLMQAVPSLLRLLDEPEPDAPLLKKAHGKEIPVVRELVRVNHLSNCLLCHAISTSIWEPLRGRVPIPGESLNGPSGVYSGTSGISVFVRADVTYLRPDFSVMQTVSRPGAWPARQRFDYLVRTRPLSGEEQQAWQAGKSLAISRPLSAHRRAALFALRELTGQEPEQTGLTRRLLFSEFEAASVERRQPRPGAPDMNR